MALPQTQRTLLQPDKQSTTIVLTTAPIPDPKPSSTEHLVHVHSTAITNGELLWEKNYAKPDPRIPARVLVPCSDVAGTVVSAPASSPFKIGDEVYARRSFGRIGCARDFTILLTEEMAKRPQNMTWEEAATVPMSVLTAWQALFIHGGLTASAAEGAKGLRIFVTAASGGVGTWVVQLAKWAGAEVIASCGTDNVEWVRSLGASIVLDRTKVDIKMWVNSDGKKADVVIDCMGGKSLIDAWWAAKDGGCLISIYQPPEQMKPTGLKGSIKNLFFIMHSDGEQLAEITKLIEKENFRTALDHVYPLDQFQQAFKRVDSGKTRGKVVLDMSASSLKGAHM